MTNSQTECENLYRNLFQKLLNVDNKVIKLHCINKAKEHLYQNINNFKYYFK